MAKHFHSRSCQVFPFPFLFPIAQTYTALWSLSQEQLQQQLFALNLIEGKRLSNRAVWIIACCWFMAWGDKSIKKIADKWIFSLLKFEFDHPTYYEQGSVTVILSHNIVSSFPPGLDKYQFFSPLSYICSSLLGAPFLHQETEIPWQIWRSRAPNALLCLKWSWRCSVPLILGAWSCFHKTDSPPFWDYIFYSTMAVYKLLACL